MFGQENYVLTGLTNSGWTCSCEPTMKTATLSQDALTDRFPLTSMQHAMVLHGLRDAREGVYVQQIVCALNESLDVRNLRGAWRRLVNRHAVLRTCFHLDDGDEPFQKVCRRIVWEMDESDWRESGIEARRATTRGLSAR